MSLSTKNLDALFQSRVVLHAIFWVTTGILLAYYSSLFGGSFENNLIQMCITMPIQMAAAYLMIYIQIQRWLFRKYWLWFLVSLPVIAYFFAVLSRLSNIYIVEPLTNYEGYDESLWEVLSDPVYLIKVYIPLVYTPAFLMLILKMVKDRVAQENKLIALEKEKRTTELNFLKAQMNPHFLFNTLNNIYSLAKNQSEQTPEMILKLSELLDYTIYECNEATVPVSKEWQLIENYVDLQAMRHSDKLMIAINQDIDDEDAPIAPLILISLVENAFKHSLVRMEKLSNIKIFLKVKQRVLTFEIFNTKSSDNVAKADKQKKGIGIENFKRQLALLYPDRHELTISDLPESYQVTLTIEL